jgi:hypothetical protein
VTPEEFFEGHEASRQIFERVRQVVNALGAAELHVTKSQIAFRRRTAFAWVWRPGQYLRGQSVAPLVLTVALRRRDTSSRWKQIVEPSRGRFTHHLELYTVQDVDDEVREWVREAWMTSA